MYAFTQRLLAYNSNRIEGSTLTEEQTASLFDHGTLPKSDDYYRAKDVEEMNGHFLMFHKMLETLEQQFFWRNAAILYSGQSPFPAFIFSTNPAFFTVISTHAGRKPLLMALRTDFILDQAAQ